MSQDNAAHERLAPRRESGNWRAGEKRAARTGSLAQEFNYQRPMGPADAFS